MNYKLSFKNNQIKKKKGIYDLNGSLSTCPVERPRPCPRPRPAFLSSSVVGHRCKWISSTDWFTNWDAQCGHVAGSLSGMEQSQLSGWWGSCNNGAAAKFSLLTGSYATKNERDNCPVLCLGTELNISAERRKKNVNKKIIQSKTTFDTFLKCCTTYLLWYQAFFFFFLEDWRLV